MNIFEKDMLTYKDKVAIHNARNALERHMYSGILHDSTITKIMWQPKNYLDYIVHLAEHRLQANLAFYNIYLRTAPFPTIDPTHRQCSECGAVSPMENEHE